MRRFTVCTSFPIALEFGLAASAGRPRIGIQSAHMAALGLSELGAVCGSQRAKGATERVAEVARFTLPLARRERLCFTLHCHVPCRAGLIPRPKLF
jgi:hypothetical protein